MLLLSALCTNPWCKCSTGHSTERQLMACSWHF